MGAANGLPAMPKWHFRVSFFPKSFKAAERPEKNTCKSENLLARGSLTLLHSIKMRLKFAIPLAFAAAYLPAAHNAQAQITYAGGTTAGDLPATAEVVPGVAGVTYNAISGTTLPTATGDNTYNGDMYEITVASPVSFTASTTAFVPGSNDFDDQISLFTSTGVGIDTNDDAASGGDQSSLTAVSLLAGNYYLLINGSGNYPVDSTGALIFPNFNSGVSSEGTYGPSSALPISAYTGYTNEGGSYLIALSLIPVVPEPSTLAALAAGLGGLTLVLRRRRRLP
jgi:hypothetical protein